MARLSNRTILLVLMMAAVMLAGCSSKAQKQPESSIDTAFKDVVPTQSRGVIKGVVVDQAIRPLGEAVVELKDQPQKATTGTDGLFSFIDLEPGTYFVQASKFGYNSTLTSVEVVAGVDPEVLNVPMIANPTEQPYLEIHQMDGYIQCGVAGQLDYCGLFGGGDFFFPFFEMTYGVPSWIQVEVVWESTQPAGDELRLSMYNETDYTAYYRKNVTGSSPIVGTFNAEEIADYRYGVDSELALSLSASETGVTVQQQFSVYLHIFYRFLPPEGWLFSRDGNPPVPTV